MGFRGTLTKDNLGFSIPSDGPLYPGPPYLYQDATMMIFEFETDGESAARLLPAQAELPDPAHAGLVFASYPSSNLGPYQEAVLFLKDVQYEGRTVKYATHLYVTTDIAMAAGRELAGFPKKIAAIDVHQEGDDYSATLERPAGVRLASGSLTLGPVLAEGVTETLNYLTLRVLPSPTKGAPPSLAELIETDWVIRNAKVWSATGECRLTGASAQDPLQIVPIVTPLGCTVIRGDLMVALNHTPRIRPL